MATESEYRPGLHPLVDSAGCWFLPVADGRPTDAVFADPRLRRRGTLGFVADSATLRGQSEVGAANASDATFTVLHAAAGQMAPAE